MIEKIILNPIFSKSGIIVKYPQKDIDKINDLNLDMIYGNADYHFVSEEIY